MEWKLELQKYPIASCVTWDDVVRKISLEYDDPKNIKLLNDGLHAPTIVLHRPIYPNSLNDVYKYVHEHASAYNMHVYVSFGKDSPTFGRHKDKMDVLIVQAIGSIKYSFDDASVVLEPGDALFIPNGLYHAPTVTGARVTLSFGVTV